MPVSAMQTKLSRTALPLFCLALSAPAATSAATIYADASLGANCAGSYSASSRACGSGTETAYRTLASAVAAAQPGDTVLVRAGTYSERLVPPRSGTTSHNIVIKNYASEVPLLTGSSEPSIALTGRSYLVIEGLRIDNVGGWGRLEDSTYNVLRNNAFSRATIEGTTGGLKLVRSHYNKLLNNTLEDGNDSIVIQESDRNLVEGNIVTKARHSLFSLRCGNFNVIRGNTFHNTDQKAGEIYDCEGTSDAPVKLDATKRNLVDDNRFTYTAAASADYRYNGIQYSGQNGIVRRNVFYDNQGGALNFQVYSDEALHNYGHRLYNNTFFNNRCYAISASGSSTSSRYTDNRVINNILYKNAGCAGEQSQTNIGNASAVVLSNNSVTTTSPMFVNEGARNLQLQPASPVVDAGVFVTQTANAGSGTVITVADVGYFYDGYGIPGEIGDLIQLQGQTQTARVVSINYTTRQLTITPQLSWSSGQGVHLAFAGAKPDTGAFESGLNTTQPMPPTDLQVTP